MHGTLEEVFTCLSGKTALIVCNARLSKWAKQESDCPCNGVSIGDHKKEQINYGQYNSKAVNFL